ncbi:hypothetical protein [Thermogemmatispora tikiterensis]|uniref:Uncharacterized protein n=1 Tax=Thermogemmatispora tikiterensis TaxID=1825093 RepID=A0A328VL24_9CHLR|nr:hypothetical protein [Thermogemmatispora tikiterensis]RAQ96293.1 hypothetical protein A4R35_12175 [Thermogemmatispora tikiterensis]
MAELSGPTGSPDPQQPLDPVLFADRVGFPPAPSGECSVVTASPAESVPLSSLPAQDTAPAAASPAMAPVPLPRCAMLVTVAQGNPPELVHVPFIEASDPEFVKGYYYGTMSYFIDGDREDDFHRVLTDQALIEEVLQIFTEGEVYEEPPDGSSWQEWAAWTAGFLAGLISARLPSSLPLYGNCEACHQPVRAVAIAPAATVPAPVCLL